MFKNAVLKIWIKGKPVEQGKFWREGKKAFYLQNVDDVKWIRMVGGYAIAEQILESFTKTKLRPKIIFFFKQKGWAYSTNQTQFNKHGMPYPYGDHRQRAMSVKWMKLENEFTEPFDLPVVNLDEWSKEEQKIEVLEKGSWITI